MKERESRIQRIQNDRIQFSGFLLLTSVFCLLISDFWFPASAFAACTNPAGAGGAILYNSDNSVLQWCDGAQWIGLPGGGTGGAGCTNPDGPGGAILYNSDNSVLQWCDGAQWIGLPNDPKISTAVWPSSATLDNPAPASSDLFGKSVAVDGTTAVVGKPGTEFNTTIPGTAYVFDTTDGSLIVTLDNPAPANGDTFGWSVAVDGTIAVVGTPQDDPGGVSGAGTAYVFDTSDGSLIATLNNPAPATGDAFGQSVAVDGTIAVVGAPHDEPGGVSNAGTAYVFDTTDGSLIATLNNPDLTTNDQFGSSVAVSGTTAVVGTPRNDPGGITDAGTAYVFDTTDGSLIATLDNPFPKDGDEFGDSVAVDGTIAVVGAWSNNPGFIDAGSAYVLDITDGSLIAELGSPAPEHDDNFGISVAVDGTIAVVGAHRDDPGGVSSAGTAYMFDTTDGSLIATLNNPAPASGDQFGNSVAVSGTTAVVGAHRDDPGGVSSAGTAYVFTSPTSCIDPSGTGGAILYNSDNAVMQWCDGTHWIGFPRPPIPKTVFVTSTTYDGDLMTAGSGADGIAGADNICNTRAAAGGLSGTYKAWIAASYTTRPLDRFNTEGPLREDLKYTLPNGTVIAESWADLTDGTLAAAITIDELGGTQSGTGNVWSNARDDGFAVDPTVDCSDWTTGSGGSNRGRAGDSSATGAAWADNDNPQCNNLLRLYCFEQ